MVVDAGSSQDSNMGAAPPTSTLMLKCQFPGDNRQIEIAQTITFDNLCRSVQLAYGRPLVLKYKDDDSELYTLDSAPSMRAAFAKFAARNDFRVFLVDVFAQKMGNFQPPKLGGPKTALGMPPPMQASKTKK